MHPIVKILTSRDDYSLEDAKALLSELRERALAGEDPEELLYEIGLEPDYVFDLLDE